MKALIVVDIQIDFCPGGALAVQEGDLIVPLVNRVREDYDLVVFTQDWHPADHQSFAANHPGKKIGDLIDLDGLPQVLWPVHCVQETVGAKFHPSLDIRSTDKVFRKGTDPRVDSYSAFFDNAHRKSTGLADYLRGRRVTRLSLCGLATDYCVKFSALDAIQEGFQVAVLSQLCRGVNLQPQDSHHALIEMKAAGASIVP